MHGGVFANFVSFSHRDDILRAVGKLKNLGNGFTVIPFGSDFLVQSIPGELNMDHTTILQQAQVLDQFSTLAAATFL